MERLPFRYSLVIVKELKNLSYQAANVSRYHVSTWMPAGQGKIGVIRVGDEFYRAHFCENAESLVFMRLRACVWHSHP